MPFDINIAVALAFLRISRVFRSSPSLVAQFLGVSHG